jgi:membrane associated rhomboid family serine protease
MSHSLLGMLAGRMSTDPMSAVREACTSHEADEYGLVLTASGIAYQVERDDGWFTVLVFPDDVPRAERALAAYDEETRRDPHVAAEQQEPSDVAWTAGIAVGLLLLGFFAVTGASAARSRWFEHGAAAAGRMASEPWRAVTALTLHVDAVHVAGNAVATALLLPAVAGRCGPGLAVLLLTVGGAAANLLGALAHDPRHSAVGASTATFAAIGILAALRLVTPPSPAMPGRKRWTVIGAAVVLLALLSSGQNVDVLAHAIGLLVGGVLGTGAGLALRQRPGLAVQSACGVVAVLLVAGAWRLALGAIG